MANAIGIIIGIVLSKRILEKAIKYVSASIFIFFVLIGIYDVLSTWLNLIFNIFLSTLVVCSIYFAYSIYKKITLFNKETRKLNLGKCIF